MAVVALSMQYFSYKFHRFVFAYVYPHGLIGSYGSDGLDSNFSVPTVQSRLLMIEAVAYCMTAHQSPAVRG